MTMGGIRTGRPQNGFGVHGGLPTTVYLAILLRNTIRRSVDLYDFLLLSA